MQELANFQWAEGPNWRSFKMIDPSGKTTFFGEVRGRRCRVSALTGSGLRSLWGVRARVRARRAWHGEGSAGHKPGSQRNL